MSLVTYVDVGGLRVRGKVENGNNNQVVLVEATSYANNDEIEEEVVLVLTGSMAEALRDNMVKHVTRNEPKEG